MRTILQAVALAKTACNRRCAWSSRPHGTGFASPRSLRVRQFTIPLMSFSTISALCPLDGRYAGKLAALRPLMSEMGFMQRRV